MSDASQPAGWPPRWLELDKRTIEFIARLNEEERNNLIELAHLSDEQLKRFREMLAVAPEVWEAGIKLASRSATWTRFTKRFPLVVVSLAGFLVASRTIWEIVGPVLKAYFQGGKP